MKIKEKNTALFTASLKSMAAALLLMLTVSCGDDPVPAPAPIAVTGVTLTPATATLEVGDTLRLVATVLPSNAANKNVTWSSSNEAVVRVSSTGLLTAIAADTATITVTTQDGGKTATCSITVNEPAPAPVPSITMVTKKSGEFDMRLAGSGEITIDWGAGSEPETHTLLPDNDRYSHYYSDTVAREIRIYGGNITMLNYMGHNNHIYSLDVSSSTALRNLTCSNNHISSLDVSNNTALTDLDCSANPLKNLDVSHNTALITLICFHNQLTVLDLSNNTALKDLRCFANQLTAEKLNSMFGTLHGNTVGEAKTVYIGDNPGTDYCDDSIAESKGWTVAFW